MKVHNGVIAIGSRSVAFFLSISLILNRSYALAYPSPCPTVRITPTAEFFESEALTQPLVEAWHHDLSRNPIIIIRRIKELVRVARAYQSRPDGLTLSQIFRLERAKLLFGLQEADGTYMGELWR